MFVTEKSINSTKSKSNQGYKNYIGIFYFQGFGFLNFRFLEKKVNYSDTCTQGT